MCQCDNFNLESQSAISENFSLSHCHHNISKHKCSSSPMDPDNTPSPCWRCKHFLLDSKDVCKLESQFLTTLLECPNLQSLLMECMKSRPMPPASRLFFIYVVLDTSFRCQLTRNMSWIKQTFGECETKCQRSCQRRRRGRYQRRRGR